jgi:precorrin-6A/cobalt-precorrin-6A reductase
MRLLILGGTGEARALALVLLDRSELSFESSLAGRVRNPALPVGAVRIGGFGGAQGLADYLDSGGFGAVIDATHPFAQTISEHAVVACAAARVPLLVLRRPGWTAIEGDDWTWVRDIETAAATIAQRPPGTVLLTTGRRDLAVFADDSSHDYVVRTVDPPSGPTPPRMTLLLDRGPYTIEGELALMRAHVVRCLVTKDSGGVMTSAKLTAARTLGLPVIIVRRPAVPAGVTAVDSVDAALNWVLTI